MEMTGKKALEDTMKRHVSIFRIDDGGSKKSGSFCKDRQKVRGGAWERKGDLHKRRYNTKTQRQWQNTEEEPGSVKYVETCNCRRQKLNHEWYEVPMAIQAVVPNY
ncbi:hypothetical protein RUM44_002567 [Polyplax serrata]|uniref:Uncharacterized protein n=1 Tax=Polyplax serrata TaxID=468196 RepID=A0ABR1AFM1_POLSC